MNDTSIQVLELPVGELLYRGNPDLSALTLSQIDDGKVPPMWFTTDVNSAKIYGYPIEYQVVAHPINVVDMGDIVTRNVVEKMMPALVDAAYPLQANGQIMRHSEFVQDQLFLDEFKTKDQFKQYDGFGSLQLPNADETEHHDEFLLYFPKLLLRETGQRVEVTPRDVERYKYLYMTRMDASKRQQKPKNRAALKSVAKSLF